MINSLQLRLSHRPRAVASHAAAVLAANREIKHALDKRFPVRSTVLLKPVYTRSLPSVKDLFVTKGPRFESSG